MNVDLQGIGMTSQRTRTRLIARLSEMGIVSEEVLAAIMNTPRHIFVDEALASRAYENTALPIGYNQTISQPYIVAKMVEVLLAAGQVRSVLEIGTGCGYQTAVLSRLVDQVCSIERIDALLQKAREKLRLLKCNNVRVKYGDGNMGWPEYAPFDGIIVSAAPAGVPETLLGQLAINGRLVIPVGKAGEQQLQLITRTPAGFEKEQLDMVSFVPMLEGIVG